MALRLPIATLPALLVVAASGLSIVLRFDGSLRPPIDSVPGFTYAPITFDGDASRPLEGSDRFASCSAAVSIVDDGDKAKYHAVLQGGWRGWTARACSWEAGSGW